MKRRINGKTVRIGSARKGYRIWVSDSDANILLPEFSLIEQAEKFALSGVELCRRGGLYPHEVVGRLLRK